MDCDHLTERWPDYAAGTIGPAERAAIDRHLAECAGCRAEADGLGQVWQLLGGLPDEAPSRGLRDRVDAMVDAWREGAQAGDRARHEAEPVAAATPWWKALFLRPAWQVGFAALCLAVGFAGGRSWMPRPSGELADLRSEVQGMKQLVALSLLQQQSATDRLRGVTWSHELERPDAEVLEALLETLRHDPNVNVRLAAVDTLQEFAGAQQRGDLRAGMIEAIPRQDSPLVQIALMDALVRLRESRSVGVLKSLETAEGVNDVVRKRASWAIQQLGKQS